MAEFCLDCWNRMNESHDTEKDWVLSEEPELCEGCGNYVPVIVTERKGFSLFQFWWKEKFCKK